MLRDAYAGSDADCSSFAALRLRERAMDSRSPRPHKTLTRGEACQSERERLSSAPVISRDDSLRGELAKASELRSRLRALRYVAVAAAAAPSGVSDAKASESGRVVETVVEILKRSFSSPPVASAQTLALKHDAISAPRIHSEGSWPKRASCEAGRERSNTTPSRPAAPSLDFGSRRGRPERARGRSRARALKH
jgi:hypothetical protein